MGTAHVGPPAGCASARHTLRPPRHDAMQRGVPGGEEWGLTSLTPTMLGCSRLSSTLISRTLVSGKPAGGICFLGGKGRTRAWLMATWSAERWWG